MFFKVVFFVMVAIFIDYVVKWHMMLFEVVDFIKCSSLRFKEILRDVTRHAHLGWMLLAWHVTCRDKMGMVCDNSRDFPKYMNISMACNILRQNGCGV